MGLGTLSSVNIGNVGRDAWLQDAHSATWSVPAKWDDRLYFEAQDIARRRTSSLSHVQFHETHEDEREGILDIFTSPEHQHEDRPRYRPPSSHTSDNVNVPRTVLQFDSSTQDRAAIIEPQRIPQNPTLTQENDPFQTQSSPSNVETSTSRNNTEVFGDLPSPITRTEEKQIQMAHRPEVLWQQIRKQRILNNDLQSRVHEARVVLRDKQITKSIVEDNLFQRIREKEYLGVVPEEKGSSSHRRTVLELVESCQSARDEYGALDIECTDLEDQLKSEEFALKRLEEEFYPLISAIIKSNSSQILSQQPASSVSAGGSISDILEGSELHPLTSRFLSRLGELDQLNERRDDLLEEKYYLTEEQATRAHMGIALSAENQATLASFGATERLLIEEIAVASNEVDGLRKACLRRGFIDRFDEPTANQSDEAQEFGSDQGIDAQDNTSEYVKYPVLLPRPGSRQDIQSVDLEPDEESEITKTNKRINHWLLEQLRTSPLQVFSLAIIRNWYSDGTLHNSSRAFSHSPSTLPSGGSLNTQADATPDHSNVERRGKYH